jgi:predicted O-methyltransferase YrrM
MNHTEIITSIFASCGYKNYLELGLYQGETLQAISQYASFAIGVDRKDLRLNKSLNLFLGTTTDFFINNQNKFDMIFIDADHHVDAIQRDLIESLKILNEYGTIILHDTDPNNKMLLDPGYCNNAYLIHNFLNATGLTWITLPINECGLTIVRRSRDMRHIKIL